LIHISTILKHYKRPEIQKEIIDNAIDREVAVRFNDKFGKRPDVLTYPNDILELAKQGATSFHASEELWKNPLHLGQDMKKKEIEDLRKGWDLVLDIDCHFIEYSKHAADLVIKALKYHNINAISCKFSGNKGFHIGVPFEAFPEMINNVETKFMFPELPRRIALYITELIKKPLANKIMELEGNNFSKIIDKTGSKKEDIIYYQKDTLGTKIPHLNVEPFLEIDTILLSSRHLYRMPYSLHEKSGLVSVVINPDKVLKFEKIIADPNNVRISRFKFLDKNVERNQAKNLIVQAYDFKPKEEEKKEKPQQEYEALQDAIPEDFFPPCIKKIASGLEDGRKRSMFVLINFLTNIGWDYDQIEKWMENWNKKNPEPLREVLIKGHIKYHKQKKEKILPPNCVNKSYYIDLRLCTPDNLCPRIKNPVNYAKIKAKIANKHQKNKKTSSKPTKAQ